VITSATGAALQDMLRVASERWRLLHVSVYDVLVQGESASSQIASAIKRADKKGYDIIIIGRGGGSIEDLWAFNEVEVADAIFVADTPIVSAVGHEIDWLISDMVADLRAPTPSAAMQMILPDSAEFLQGIDVMRNRLDTQLKHILEKKNEELKYLMQSFQRHSIEQKLLVYKNEINRLKDEFNRQILNKLERLKRELEPLHVRLNHAIIQNLNHYENTILSLKKAYESADPKLRSKRGYAQIVKESKVIALQELHVKDKITLMDAKTEVLAEVLSKRELR
jgi:exodeoxyribonuclease VII large subunit